MSKTEFLNQKEKKLLTLLIDKGYFQNKIDLSSLASGFGVSTVDVKALSAKIFTEYICKTLSFEEAQKEINTLAKAYTESMRLRDKIHSDQIEKLLEILDEPNTRPTHKWIINNLDKAEQVEFAFRKLESQLKRLYDVLLIPRKANYEVTLNQEMKDYLRQPREGIPRSEQSKEKK